MLDRAAVGSSNRGELIEHDEDDPTPPGEDTPILVSDDVRTPPAIKFPGKPRGPDNEPGPDEDG